MNPFDQFDEKGGNPFDRFDAPPEDPPQRRPGFLPPDTITDSDVIADGPSVLSKIPDFIARGFRGELGNGRPVLLPISKGPDGLGFGHSETTAAMQRGVENPGDILRGEILPTIPNLIKAANETTGVITTGGLATPSVLIPAGAKTMNAVEPPLKASAKAAGKAISTVAAPIIDRIDVEGGIGRSLLKRVMADNPGMSAEEAIMATELQLKRLGAPSMLADTGKASQKLARNMAAAPGETAQLAETNLAARQAAEKTATIDTVKRNISDRDFYDAAAEARKGRQASGPLFKEAYDAFPNVSNDKLRLFIQQEPAIRQAMNKGLALERTAASDAGEVFDPATFGVITKFNEAGDPIIEQFQATPLKLWHVTKRGLDAMLAKKKNALGKLDTTDPETDALLKLRKSLDRELKNITGGEEGAYAKANKMASESYKLEDALNAGRAFAKGDEELTEKMFKGLTPQEQDAYRVGVAREMVAMIRKTSGQLTPAQIMSAVLDEAGIRQKLKIIAPTEKQFNDFIGDLETRLAFRKTSQGVRNVSQTGSIAMEEGAIARDAMENAQRGAGVALDLGRGNVAGAGMRLVDWGLIQLGRMRMPQEMRDRIGRLLLSSDPADKEEALRLMRAVAPSQTLPKPPTGLGQRP